MKRLACALVVGVSLACLSLVATVQGGGKAAGKLAIGDSAPAFSALPGVDGKTHSLADYKQDVLVLCVTCNHCPMAVAYEERMVDFAKKYATGPKAKVGFVAICVNSGDTEDIANMTKRAKAQGFNYDYVRDDSQQVGRQLGARVTPEFYVFNKERKLVYTGAMDDDRDAPTTNYVSQAVDAALKGTAPATTTTSARGCGISYKKSASN